MSESNNVVETAQTETATAVAEAPKRQRQAAPNANIPQYIPGDPDSLANSVREWGRIPKSDSVNSSTFNSNGFMGQGALTGRNPEMTMGRTLNCSAQAAFVLAGQATQHRDSLAALRDLADFIGGLADRAETAYNAHASIKDSLL